MEYILAAVGLNLNTSKTKILTTESLKEPMFLAIGGDRIEVLHGEQNHKYLSKKLCRDLRKRAMVDIQHRSQIAWMKFNEHKDTLLNRHVSLRLRLKLFDSVITPTIVFGFMTCPLTSNQLQKLEVVRNRMFRSIVGWAPLVDNDWHALMKKMNKKLENAQKILNVRPWTERLLVGRFRFAAKISSAVNSWASITSEWYPYQRWKMNYCVEPRRRIGRPAKRWDDQIESFAQEVFHSSWFQAAKSETWSSHEKAFVKWCLEC